MKSEVTRMLLKAMPVLHARTYNIDFRTGKLLIEPETFSPSDSDTIYKLATESTRRRELAPSCGRFVIYGSRSYSVVGRTVRFSDLYGRCGKEPKYIKVDKDDGRLAYGFVGLMIKTGSQNEPIDLSDELILDIYERCIEKRWEETENDEHAYDTMKIGFMDFDVQPKSIALNYKPILEQSSRPIILEDNDDLREQIVYSAMSQAFAGNTISLCTSVSVFNKDIFSIITCKDAASKIQEITKAIEQIPTDSLRESEHSQVYSAPRNSKNSGSKTLAGKGKIEKPFGMDKQTRVRSLDDLLSETEVPDNNYGNLQKKNSGTEQGSIFDKGIILGTILGITFIVVEIAKNSNPILIALTSTATVVLAGIEAKRVIEKFKS